MLVLHTTQLTIGGNGAAEFRMREFSISTAGYSRNEAYLSSHR